MKNYNLKVKIILLWFVGTEHARILCNTLKRTINYKYIIEIISPIKQFNTSVPLFSGHVQQSPSSVSWP